jgi:hypothetical protein
LLLIVDTLVLIDTSADVDVDNTTEALKPFDVAIDLVVLTFVLDEVSLLVAVERFVLPCVPALVPVDNAVDVLVPLEVSADVDVESTTLPC